MQMQSHSANGMNEENEVFRMRVLRRDMNRIMFLVPMRSGETPVPIPNTMVKP